MNIIHRHKLFWGLFVFLVLCISNVFAEDGQPSSIEAGLEKNESKSQEEVREEPVDDEAEINIIKALDEVTSLEVDDTPLREAIQRLSKNTGIPIEIEPRVYGLLPYGSQTSLTATIPSEPLRTCLVGLLRPIGLTFEVQADKLLIKPTIHLSRLVRRAIWEELETLEMLYSQPWSEELFESLRFQFQDSPAADNETNRNTLKRYAGAVGEGTAAEVLEHACDQYSWAWYPSDDYIAIVTKSQQIKRQLEQPVSLKYTNKTLTEALLDLEKRSGVKFRMDPGVLASVSPQFSNRFSFTIQNSTIRQALETISAHTGLGYYIEPDGIRFTTSTYTPAVVPSVPSNSGTNMALPEAIESYLNNPVVGQITVPTKDGATFSFFIREKDLPPEVNDMRKSKIKMAVDEIRKNLVKELRKD